MTDENKPLPVDSLPSEPAALNYEAPDLKLNRMGAKIAAAALTLPLGIAGIIHLGSDVKTQRAEQNDITNRINQLGLPADILQGAYPCDKDGHYRFAPSHKPNPAVDDYLFGLPEQIQDEYIQSKAKEHTDEAALAVLGLALLAAGYSLKGDDVKKSLLLGAAIVGSGAVIGSHTANVIRKQNDQEQWLQVYAQENNIPAEVITQNAPIPMKNERAAVEAWRKQNAPISEQMERDFVEVLRNQEGQVTKDVEGWRKEYRESESVKHTTKTHAVLEVGAEVLGVSAIGLLAARRKKQAAPQR